MIWFWNYEVTERSSTVSVCDDCQTKHFIAYAVLVSKKILSTMSLAKTRQGE